MSEALTVIGSVANVFGGVVYPAKDILVAVSSSIERVSSFNDVCYLASQKFVGKTE